ncbi:MAG: tripartite tricarboxylate transporter substrate binding protein [Ottowia sp.]|uniref:Bug family tripartite tricarboxylate transporter substrate binding protein n=1 Tax=unclassified Ottowia TaxID=2645081 RepID=UPI003C2B2E7C
MTRPVPTIVPCKRMGRAAAALVLAAANLFMAAPAQAQGAFPAKPVNIFTPFPPGSGPDALLRTITDKLSKLWGQPVLVQNRPGAGGFVVFEATRRLPPDGYTLVQLDSEQLAALPLLYKSRNFNTLQAYDPVASLYNTPFLVTVPVNSLWRSIGDLVAAAKAEPGKINYGSWGVGSPGHLGGEQLELATGIEMQHIPFKDSGQMFTALAGNEIAWAFGSIPSSLGVYQSKKVRYLAVATPKRIPQMPEVPTVAEAGGPKEFTQSSFVILAAPKGIVPAVQQKIEQDVAKVLQDADIRERMETFAFEPINWSPREIRRQALEKGKLYEQLIKRKNISLE